MKKRTKYIKKLLILTILIFGVLFNADAAMNIIYKDTITTVDNQQDSIKNEAAKDAIEHYNDHSFLLKGVFLS